MASRGRRHKTIGVFLAMSFVALALTPTGGVFAQPQPPTQEGEAEPQGENEAPSVDPPAPPSRKEIRDVIIALDKNVVKISTEAKNVEDLEAEIAQLEEVIAEQQEELSSGLTEELAVEQEKLSSLESSRAAEQFLLDRDKRRLGKIATDMYMDKGKTLPSAFGELEDFSSYRVGQTLELSISNLRQNIRDRENEIATIDEDIVSQKNSMAELQLQVSELQQSITADNEQLVAAQQDIETKTADIASLRAANLSLQVQIVGMLRLVGSPANSGTDPSIAVMSESVLTAEQLTGWFQATRGNLQVGENNVAELAKLYIEEGKSLGVRGDIAFIQAVLETGNFVYTGKNNFAGIGHCDSCERGYPFATPRDGVRAQIQLLRSYADKNVKTADLHGGAQPGINPDKLGVRGCCASWWGLTGVWATALHYGGTILKMYDEAVLYTLRTATPTTSE